MPRHHDRRDSGQTGVASATHEGKNLQNPRAQHRLGFGDSGPMTALLARKRNALVAAAREG